MSPQSFQPFHHQRVREARLSELGLVCEVRHWPTDPEHLRLRFGCACLIHGYLLLERDHNIGVICRIAAGPSLN